MASDDAWGVIKGGCPYCNGDLSYFHLGADCRGNDVSRGVTCQGKSSETSTKGCGYSERRIPPWVREHVRSGKKVEGKQGTL